MQFFIKFEDLVQAMEMMPESFGPKAISQWCAAAIIDKIWSEVHELFDVIGNKHGDTGNIQTDIVRELADIFNLTFALVLHVEQFGVLFPSVLEVKHIHAPRRQRNVINAMKRLDALNGLNKEVTWGTDHVRMFLESVLEYVKPARWNIDLRDIIMMMPVKAMEKAYLPWGVKNE